jgi:hypothetical protein
LGLGENLIESLISYLIFSFLAFLNSLIYSIFHFMDNNKNNILKAEFKLEFYEFFKLKNLREKLVLELKFQDEEIEKIKNNCILFYLNLSEENILKISALQTE